MITEQFQVEPANRMRAEEPAVTAGSAADSGTNDDAAISLLLALELRGRLGDRDRELLDRVAPDGHIAFVVHEGRFVHPEDVELFPLEVIEPAFAHQGQALFAHHWQDATGRDRRRCTIHTAVIETVGGASFVLGFLGPDRGSDAQRASDRYGGMVARLRRLQEELREPLGRAHEHLAKDQAGLVVDRDSGRVAAVNEAAEVLLGLAGEILVGRPFSCLSEKRRASAPRTKIGLTNLDHPRLRLALVALEADVAADADAPDDPFVADFFIHRLRRRLSNIMVSVSLLQAQNEHRLRPDEQALMQGVLAQAQKANSYLSEMNLLLNYEALPRCESGLLTELEHAVDLAREELPQGLEAEITCSPERAIVTAPRGIHLRLLRAALLTHGAGENQTCRCRIAVRPSDSEGLEVTIESETKTDSSANPDRAAWRGLAERLAARAGVEYTAPADGAGILRSRLQIKGDHTGGQQ